MQWKGRRLLEDHLWLHTHDHYGVRAGVPQADPSTAAIVGGWVGTVGSSIPESLVTDITDRYPIFHIAHFANLRSLKDDCHLTRKMNLKNNETFKILSHHTTGPMSPIMILVRMHSPYFMTT